MHHEDICLEAGLPSSRTLPCASTCKTCEPVQALPSTVLLTSGTMFVFYRLARQQHPPYRLLLQSKPLAMDLGGQPTPEIIAPQLQAVVSTCCRGMHHTLRCMNVSLQRVACGIQRPMTAALSATVLTSGCTRVQSQPVLGTLQVTHAACSAMHTLQALP